MIFFGGTALSRTHLVAGRISEDVDLIARGRRADAVRAVRTAVEQGLLRSHGRLSWKPDFDERDVEPAVVTTPDGLAIRLQILSQTGYAAWPIELTDIEQRYADVPPTQLYVPIVESFAAWKTAAWFDRRAARDLFDLWVLAGCGQLTADAANLFTRHGPTNGPPQPFMFDRPPTEAQWVAQLAAQTRLTVTAAEALAAVRDAWAAAVGSAPDS